MPDWGGSWEITHRQCREHAAERLGPIVKLHWGLAGNVCFYIIKAFTKLSLGIKRVINPLGKKFLSQSQLVSKRKLAKYLYIRSRMWRVCNQLCDVKSKRKSFSPSRCRMCCDFRMVNWRHHLPLSSSTMGNWSKVEFCIYRRESTQKTKKTVAFVLGFIEDIYVNCTLGIQLSLPPGVEEYCIPLDEIIILWECKQ